MTVQIVIHLGKGAGEYFTDLRKVCQQALLIPDQEINQLVFEYAGPIKGFFSHITYIVIGPLCSAV